MEFIAVVSAVLALIWAFIVVWWMMRIVHLLERVAEETEGTRSAVRQLHGILRRGEAGSIPRAKAAAAEEPGDLMDTGQGDSIRCFCEHCGQPLVFPASSAGEIVSCPHCGESTPCPAAGSDVGPTP
jgi:hypothetical protein